MRSFDYTKPEAARAKYKSDTENFAGFIAYGSSTSIMQVSEASHRYEPCVQEGFLFGIDKGRCRNVSEVFGEFVFI